MIYNIVKLVAEERWKMSYAVGVFGQIGWLFLIARETQRMVTEYWGWTPGLKYLLVVGCLGLWMAGRLIWWTGLPRREMEKSWRAMTGG